MFDPGRVKVTGLQKEIVQVPFIGNWLVLVGPSLSQGQKNKEEEF